MDFDPCLGPAFDDAQPFPDTQYVTYEYAEADGQRRLLIYEPRLWSPGVQEGHENGNAFYGTEGMLILGKHSGCHCFGRRNVLNEKGEGRLDLGAHVRDFLDAIKAGRDPAADIEAEHGAAALAHLGNIAAQLGCTLHFDPAANRSWGTPKPTRSCAGPIGRGTWRCRRESNSGSARATPSDGPSATAVTAGLGSRA